MVWFRRAPFEEIGSFLYWGCGPALGLSGAFAVWKLGPYTIFKLYPEGYGAGLNLYWKGWRVLGLDWHQWHIRQDLKTGKPLHPKDQYALNRPHIDLPLWEYHHWPWTQLPHSSEVAAVKVAKDEKRAAKAEKKAERKARREVQLALKAASKASGTTSPSLSDTSISSSPTDSSTRSSPTDYPAPPESSSPTPILDMEFAQTLLHGFPASTSFDDLGVLLGDENSALLKDESQQKQSTAESIQEMLMQPDSSTNFTPKSPLRLLYDSSETTHRKQPDSRQGDASPPSTTTIKEPVPLHAPAAHRSKFSISNEEPPIDDDVLG